jgi:hypothetical protein
MPEKPSTPKPAPTRTTGLSPKEQKLQALRAKLASSAATKPGAAPASAPSFKAKANIARKTAFQRKAT